jgi:hypothetical protein
MRRMRKPFLSSTKHSHTFRSRKQQTHCFKKVRSTLVDQSSPLTEPQVLPSLSHLSRGSWFVVRGSWFVVRGSWFVVLIHWWWCRCFVGRDSHIILLVLLFRMIDCTGCCCAFFEERRGGNDSATCLRHCVATDRINGGTQSLFIRL